MQYYISNIAYAKLPLYVRLVYKDHIGRLILIN